MTYKALTKLVMTIAVLVYTAGSQKSAAQSTADSCQMAPLPVIPFAKGMVTLSATAKIMLDTAWQEIKKHPTCKLRVVGYGYNSVEYSKCAGTGWHR